tara:strand:- start:142 stop:363 length:222 start_codon:yes stop_codon:yes gene_type:complete
MSNMVNSIGSKLKIHNVNTGQKFEGIIVRNGSNFIQISARNTNTGLSFGMISLQKDRLNNWRKSETDNTLILM